MTIRTVLLSLVVIALSAGDAPPPAAIPAPVPLDAATTKRAEAAADAYLGVSAADQAKPDPVAAQMLVQVEVRLLEARSYLDLKQPLKAGDCYLDAAKKLADDALCKF